ncbi:10208_t:CDS:2 [Funneliformis caledonium]|uniref:10208_t:CDS:1 n=1 Tax=Funneliformis caledonium TaxID=1117310 RepID=A0A9N9CMF6_9GLOM|nr:10208_t:CDS:2 [Funneliformis caledonium]
METEIRNSQSDKNDIVGIETLFTSFREALNQHSKPKNIKSVLEETATKKKEILELFQQISYDLEDANYYR